MADTPTFQSNPYGSFDPSQWLNPYSQFYGKALPWPSSYAGTPTNALGQPIQPPQGMTLNSTPAQPQAPAGGGGVNSNPAGSPLNPMGNWAALAPQNPNATTPQAQANYAYALGLGGSIDPSTHMAAMGGQGAAPPAAASSAAPNNWQQTLSMLANPGHVSTPGATVPQAPQGGGQPTPGVLQNFLANWQPAQSGPGSGFTQNFNTILRGLQAKGS
jgi:hypothetical protein